jgi:uncharacterized membrane protein
MAKHHRHGIESTAALGKHPLHPMLIPFPIAFLVGALATDVTFWATRDPFWALSSFWLLAVGILMGILAAVAGLVDFLTLPEVRRLSIAWTHFLGNGLALALAAANLALRWSGTGNALVPTGLTLSAVVTVILLFTGWWGGELAYRHHIGAIDASDDAEERSPEDYLHNGHRDRRASMH